MCKEVMFFLSKVATPDPVKEFPIAEVAIGCAGALVLIMVITIVLIIERYNYHHSFLFGS